MSGRRSTVDSLELYTLTLPPYNMSIKDIAAKYGLHEVTVSKKVSAVKEKMEPIFEAQRNEIEKIKQQNAVAVREQTQGGQLIPTGSLPDIPKSNPFHGLNSFFEVANPAIQAGVVIGSSLNLINDMFDESKPREQRYEMAGKSGMALMTFGFSLYETLKTMNENNERKKQTEGQ